MDEAKVMEVLRQAEWTERTSGWDLHEKFCPGCQASPSHGHRDRCKLAALLAQATGALDADDSKEKGRIVAIMGGGDWCDVSVEHLVVPGGMDLEAEHRAYREWYLQMDSKAVYQTFPEWLTKRGARRTTDNEVLKFWEAR